MISKNIPMCSAVLDNNKLLPLFARFNIHLGFGEMTVEEVCRKHGVDPDFFLEIANAYLDEGYTSRGDMSHFSLKAMVDYLKATHSYYLDVALPRIEAKILKLVEYSGLSGKEKELVSGFFNDYREEFLSHISLEEEKILPYILELEKQSQKNVPDGQFAGYLNTYSIREFEKEHDRLETSLENLSKLIIKYLPPIKDQELCVTVLEDLAELVKDLVDHADMEDRVLIPRVARLEEQLKKSYGIR
jgi:regulator of cell morphogenesis and NO signaling